MIRLKKGKSMFDIRIILPVFAGLFLILVGFVFWSWLLERRVKAKTMELQKINVNLLLYQNLLKFSGDGAYRYTFDEGKIIFANEGLVKILDLNCSPEELVGKFLKEVLVYTDEPGTVRRAANEHGEIHDFEYHFKTLKGEDRWVIHNSLISKDEITGKKCIDAVVKDITVRKQAEQAVRESEVYFRSIFDTATDGILIADLNSKKFINGNETICRQTGYSLEEIKKLGVLDIHPEKDLPYVLDQFERQTKGEFTLARDIPVKRKDGTVFFADVNSNVVTLAGKNHLLGFFRDITERKVAEETILKSEKRFRQTLDDMMEGCMILGFDWTYLYLNETAAQHGHGNRDKLLNRTMLEMYPGVEKSAVFTRYKEVMEKRIPQRFEESFTFADGSTAWYTFSVEPVPEGIFILSIDITERKRAEEKNKSQLGELLRWQETTLGREDRVREIKREVNELCRRLGEAARYPSQEKI